MWKRGKSYLYNEPFPQISSICVENGLWKRESDIQHSQDMRLYCRFDVEMWKDLHAFTITSDF